MFIFDKERYDQLDIECYEVKIFWEVELEKNEKKVLGFHPTFMILPRMVEGGLLPKRKHSLKTCGALFFIFMFLRASLGISRA